MVYFNIFAGEISMPLESMPTETLSRQSDSDADNHDDGI